MHQGSASERVFHELVNSIHHLPEGAMPRGPTNPRQWLKLTVGVRRLQRLPELLPGCRGSMPRAVLAKTYGADPAAVERIRAFAVQHHLVVSKDDRLSARICLSGTVEDLSDAFGVRLLDYTHPELGEFHARLDPVGLLPELVGQVTGVFGFNNHRILRRTRSAPMPGAMRGTPCVGLLEFGRRVNERDLIGWFERNNQPAPPVKIVNLDWQGPASDSTGDVVRDVVWASALTDSARVAVYFAGCDARGLVDGVARLVDDDDAPQVVSINWGCDESQPLDGHIVWSPATVEHVNDSFLALGHLGVTVCVSSDDDQAREGHAHVSFPATSPYVVALGGTARSAA